MLLTKKRGFTLIELLIVISVILLLVSMLLPMVTKLQREGKKMKCQKNMGTLGQLLAQITDTRKLPKNDKIKEEFWLTLVFDNLHEAPGILKCPATTDIVDDTWKDADEAPAYSSEPRNCSYFGPYDSAAHSKIIRASSDEAIGGEHWTNHRNGVNVLFGDTHIQWYEWKEFGMDKDDPEDPFGRPWETEEANIDLTNVGGTES